MRHRPVSIWEGRERMGNTNGHGSTFEFISKLLKLCKPKRMATKGSPNLRIAKPEREE